ncbi:MAG: hypothetical protein ABW019_01550 [Chitinophagaceae bacterium]
MQKLKALAILLVIAASLVPVYAVLSWLQKAIRPRESMSRLFAYLLAALCIIFASVFLVVWIVKALFAPAS